jgi:NADPH:quinone reductase-like Zn-dependent oxidoreductase
MVERMRAIRQKVYGGPEVLELTEVERPEPLPTEVLVRVHAAGVNPVDAGTRAGRGMARLGAVGPPPFTVGWDVAGVVEAVGYGVTRFRPGDVVYGMPRFPRAAGAYAEYVTAPSRHLAAKPAELDDVHAAALPLGALTAWQALVDTARVEAGQRVLVHAAAGGVGHLAVQIAKARGAYVIGTASAANHELAREFGADELIDYTGVDFAEAVRGVDVVVNLVGGGDYGVRSLRTLRPGGLLVAVAGTSGVEEAAAHGVRCLALLVEPDRAGLEGITALVEAGLLRPRVEQVLPLEQAARAHALIETGHTRGKTVLSVA